MGLLLRAGQLLLGAAVVGGATPSCYSAGSGSAPPTKQFYFPVGLAVAPEGDVLYAINSDFDLQFSGGTLQSYDLAALRRDAGHLIRLNLGETTVPLPNDAFLGAGPACSGPPEGGVPLGQECSPPVDSLRYWKNSVIVGAFATDLQISIGAPRRIFAPVRGAAAIAWADIAGPTKRNDTPDAKFAINCGQTAASGGRCDADHAAGNDPNQLGNTRNVTMPGEPFGMAQSTDGTAMVVTHQSDTKASLLSTGLCTPDQGCTSPTSPFLLQFVLDGLPTGGVGVAAVPHDPDGPIKPCAEMQPTLPCVRPAFLETNHSTAEIDLLRFYSDDGSSLKRPFLQREAVFPLTSNAVGTDSRGIAIDPTPRAACRARGGAASACAQQAARVFFASRTPPALGIGAVGGPPPVGAGPYNPDNLVLKGNVPLLPGPSKVYLAPIVNPRGNFELRVFVVLFDSAQIAVYDPEQEIVEYIDVGPGPFAMAFDPFSLDDVAAGKPAGAMDDELNRPYRFAYVASFTQSFVQMIDLDNSQSTGATFERVVFTLGKPTVPKGQ